MPMRAAARNLLLAQLAPDLRARLASHMQLLAVGRKQVLNEPDSACRFVYFPTTAIISLVSTLTSGQSLEVGLVGRDGFAPLSILPGPLTLPYECIVQVPGEALVIAGATLSKELQSEQRLFTAIARFVQVSLARCMHMSVCNMFHPVEQRCIRWLLTMSDLTESPDIPMTHEQMAVMLGAHRPTVTQVLRDLHKRGLVGEARGHIVIRNRPELEASGCECYRAIDGERRRVLGY